MPLCMKRLCSILMLLYLQALCFPACAQAPDSFRYYNEQIDAHLTSGTIDSASALIETALRSRRYNNTVESYFFKARKMEVDYYYDLGKLGLIDAKKNLNWALEKNNAAMIMDAYNFTGLFHFMLGNWIESIESFKKGLQYLHQVKRLPFLSSESYHLQNNLAESYLKLRQPDSALKYCTRALQSATAANDKRMVALSAYQMGNVYAEKNLYSQADSLFRLAINITGENDFTDVKLICFGCLGQSKALSVTQRDAYISQGFQLLQQDTAINPFYTKDFLKQALQYFILTKNYAAQANALQRIAAIEDRKKQKELDYLITQYDEVISENEKRIALEKSNLQKSKEVQRLIIITSLVSILVLISVLIIFFLRIKRKEAVLNIRSAISRDLHDDLGSSLSSLNIYSGLLQNTSLLSPQKQHDVIHKISTITKDLMNNLHDIIWSLDKNKQQTSLEDLLKSYAMNMLTNKSIQVEIQVLPQVENILTSPKARKNILMVVKEIMNNCSKYSHAGHFQLKMFLQKKMLHIITKDDGVGFEQDATHPGNGVKNIGRRIKELSGEVVIHSLKDEGTMIELRIPEKNVRMKEYFLKSVLSRKLTNKHRVS